MQMRSILAEWCTFCPSSHATPSGHDQSSAWNSVCMCMLFWAFIISSTSFAISLIMHLLLCSEPVTAAFSPQISFNLLSTGSHATAGGVSVAELSLMLGFAYKAITSVIPFVIVNVLAESEIVLGLDWNKWCIHNDSKFYMVYFFLGCHLTSPQSSVPCPLCHLYLILIMKFYHLI